MPKDSVYADAELVQLANGQWAVKYNINYDEKPVALSPFFDTAASATEWMYSFVKARATAGTVAISWREPKESSEA